MLGNGIICIKVGTDGRRMIEYINYDSEDTLQDIFDAVMGLKNVYDEVYIVNFALDDQEDIRYIIKDAVKF